MLRLVNLRLRCIFQFPGILWTPGGGLWKALVMPLRNPPQSLVF